ncbi:MAG: hypothetical protein J6A84_03845 [Clostridia bacterium]|nr:hypothetical protein [Clostridia bacterium]
MKNKKKLIAVIVSVAVVLIALIVTVIVVSVRKNRAPALETVRGRFEQVLGASGEINEIFWGKGLPTYPRVYEEVATLRASYGEQTKKLAAYTRNDERYGTVVIYKYWLYFSPSGGEVDNDEIFYDFEKGAIIQTGKPDDAHNYRFAVRSETPIEGKTPNEFLASSMDTGDQTYYYYSIDDYDVDRVFIYQDTDDENYDFVRLDCGYLTVDDIKLAAEKVYSPSYLASVNESLFTGMTTGSAMLYARYVDQEDADSGSTALVKYNKDKGLVLTEWVYDFSTMRIVDGNATFVTVELDRYPVGNEGARERSTQRFSLENGEWYLDSPSY